MSTGRTYIGAMTTMMIQIKYKWWPEIKLSDFRTPASALRIYHMIDHFTGVIGREGGGWGVMKQVAKEANWRGSILARPCTLWKVVYLNMVDEGQNDTAIEPGCSARWNVRLFSFTLFFCGCALFAGFYPSKAISSGALAFPFTVNKIFRFICFFFSLQIFVKSLRL